MLHIGPLNDLCLLPAWPVLSALRDQNPCLAQTVMLFPAAAIPMYGLTHSLVLASLATRYCVPKLNHKTEKAPAVQPQQKLFFFLPDAVENIAIGINPKHDIFHGCVMDERALGVDKEHVRDPNLLDKTCVECATLVAAGGERQPVVLPVMSQV